MDNKLTPNQRKVSDFLESHRDSFVSPTLIGHSAGGKTSGGHQRHSSWASPICKRLVEFGLVERNVHGEYRYYQG